MKLKTILLAATLGVFAASTAIAAEEQRTAVKTVSAEAVKTENAEMKKPMKKPMKKHSHMEEKANMPMNMPMAEPAPAAAKEMPKNRHDHMKEKQ